MVKIARIGDPWSGICTCHVPPIPMTGVIITGSDKLFLGGKGVARIGDQTQGLCGHTGIISSGSDKNFSDGIGKASTDSVVTGCNDGQITDGDSKTMICNVVNLHPTRNVVHQEEIITYTEVDFGNEDDDPDIDDGLNIYPPVIGREPTEDEIERSVELDVFPTVQEEVEETEQPVVTPTPIGCSGIVAPVPDSFRLTTNFILSDLSTKTALSRTKVKDQHGLSVVDIVCNLQGWAVNIGEPLAAKYGRRTLLFTSGFRIGSSTSQHEKGQAADLQFPGWSNSQIYDAAIWIKANISYDQLILEYGGNRPWIHISFNRAGNRPSSASNKFGTRISGNNYSWRKLINMS